MHSTGVCSVAMFRFLSRFREIVAMHVARCSLKLDLGVLEGSVREGRWRPSPVCARDQGSKIDLCSHVAVLPSVQRSCRGMCGPALSALEFVFGVLNSFSRARARLSSACARGQPPFSERRGCCDPSCRAVVSAYRAPRNEHLVSCGTVSGECAVLQQAQATRALQELVTKTGMRPREFSLLSLRFEDTINTTTPRESSSLRGLAK